MRQQTKKMEDDLLVVHKPPVAASKTDADRAAELQALPADVHLLAARLRAATGADERSRLLAAIQTRFGNGFAAGVVDAVRNEPSNLPPPPGDGTPSGGEPP
jgi:hypothetical protein